VTARPATTTGRSAGIPVSRRRWALFATLAAVVVVADQLAKAVVSTTLAPGQSVDVVGDLVRIVFGQNTGALFGLFKDNAWMFGVVSLAVIGLIVAYHARSAPSLYLTITLGLLLGGAVGNMLDRLRLGYVVDFVDVGLGTTRFYTFNVADSAISLAILLLFVAAVRPALVDGAHSSPASVEPASSRAGARDGGGSDAGVGEEAADDAAFWADGDEPTAGGAG
jgi:signal peptidase II